MKKILTIIILFLQFVMFSQERNEFKTQIRDIDTDFDKISVVGNIVVVFEKRDNIMLETVDLSFDEITTKVKNRTLKIHYKSIPINSKYVKIYMPLQAAEIITASAGAEILFKEKLNCKNFDIKLNSGAKAQIKIEAENLNVSLTAGANLRIEGNVNLQNIKMSSGSDYFAEELESNLCNIKLNAGGYAKVYAKKFLNATVTAGGSIVYKANPEGIAKKVTAGGKIVSF